MSILMEQLVTFFSVVKNKRKINLQANETEIL